MDPKTEQKVMELQLLEQNLQNLNMQKQNFQNQLIEIESAQEELKKNPEKAYKIVGSIMIQTAVKELEKDLNSKKEVIDLRLKNIEKQEKVLNGKLQAIRDEVLSKLNKNG